MAVEQEQETKRRKVETTPAKKPWVFNLMVMPNPSHMHPANWAKPGDENRKYKSLDYWLKLARLAEDAKFNGIFIADVLGPYDVYKGPENFDAVARSGAQFPSVDPSAYVSAMAAVTKNVGFGVTFSTMAEPPYHFARRLATLDHLTNGRVGWNIVTSYLQSAARNMLPDGKMLSHDERYAQAEEYVDVVAKLLLSSWRDDAVVIDEKSLTYAEPSRIRKINFDGKYYKVPGPFVTEPTPQRLPVLLQAGGSPKGQDFAAKYSEVVFLMAFTPEALKKTVDSISEIALKKYGRARSSIKFVTSVQLIIGKTHEEAEAKFQDTLKYHHKEGKEALIGGWTGVDLSKFPEGVDIHVDKSDAMQTALKTYINESEVKTREGITQQIGVGTGKKRLMYGTPDEIVDEMERYVNISGIDGFNLVGVHYPETFEDVNELLVPVLRKRGFLWDDYPVDPVDGATFRENVFGVKGQTYLTEDHYLHDFRWTTEDDKAEFDKKQNNK